MNQDIKDAFSFIFVVALAASLGIIIIWGAVQLFDDTKSMTDVQQIEQKLLNNCKWKSKDSYGYGQCVSAVQKFIDEYDTNQKVEEDN